MRYLIMLSLILSGCLPCLATPDCLTEHTIRVSKDDLPVTSVHIKLETTYDYIDTWQCPSEDARCEDIGVIKAYADGMLTLTLDDGQMITQTLQSGPTQRCGCPEVNQVDIRFE